MAPRWLPLESNPGVLNKFVHNLGLDKQYGFTDVWGLDEALIAMVPKPVYAVMLLFPISETSEAHAAAEAAEIKDKGQVVSPNLFYMKQTIGNACGTMGVIHALANNQDELNIEDGPLKELFQECERLDPSERAQVLENSEAIGTSHEESAQEGQSEVPDIDEKVNLHFIAFVEKDGHLYELDGRKDGAVNHGPTSPDTLMEDSAKVVQQFMARDPEELRFTVMALVKLPTE